MYKSRFKNTIDRPLVCSDSETSNKDNKDGDDGMNDVGNAKTREDVSPSIKNTQYQDVNDSQLVVHPSIGCETRMTILSTPHHRVNDGNRLPKEERLVECINK
uniref:Uncharacterized protein n=1 Tax=Helianthus annuus TaxID=4232 RepID=A0A251S364_HELAN